jgi:heme-degrading monooxygenase HmoA
MLVIVWEFRVRPERLSDFLSANAPGGDWDRLFRRGEGYISNELLRDERDETRFLTIDRWDSREARDLFRLRFREEYEALDRRCEDFTLEETPIGDFSLPGSAR